MEEEINEQTEEANLSPELNTEIEQVWEAEEPQSQISLNALTGVPNFRTMKVTGSSKGRSITILIDTEPLITFWT